MIIMAKLLIVLRVRILSFGALLSSANRRHGLLFASRRCQRIALLLLSGGGAASDNVALRLVLAVLA